jgi:hypothetical protein
LSLLWRLSHIEGRRAISGQSTYPDGLTAQSRVLVGQPGHYIRFGVTSGSAVIREEPTVGYFAAQSQGLVALDVYRPPGSPATCKGIPEVLEAVINELPLNEQFPQPESPLHLGPFVPLAAGPS